MYEVDFTIVGTLKFQSELDQEGVALRAYNTLMKIELDCDDGMQLDVHDVALEEVRGEPEKLQYCAIAYSIERVKQGISIGCIVYDTDTLESAVGMMLSLQSTNKEFFLVYICTRMALDRFEETSLVQT